MSGKVGKIDAVDLTEFQEEAHSAGFPCWWVLREFTPDQRMKLTEAFSRRYDISAASIARVIQKWGFEVSPHAVGVHRRGDCACGKKGKA